MLLARPLDHQSGLARHAADFFRNPACTHCKAIEKVTAADQISIIKKARSEKARKRKQELGILFLKFAQHWLSRSGSVGADSRGRLHEKVIRLITRSNGQTEQGLNLQLLQFVTKVRNPPSR